MSNRYPTGQRGGGSKAKTRSKRSAKLREGTAAYRISDDVGSMQSMMFTPFNHAQQPDGGGQHATSSALPRIGAKASSSGKRSGDGGGHRRSKTVGVTAAPSSLRSAPPVWPRTTGRRSQHTVTGPGGGSGRPTKLDDELSSRHSGNAKGGGGGGGGGRGRPTAPTGLLFLGSTLASNPSTTRGRVVASKVRQPTRRPLSPPGSFSSSSVSSQRAKAGTRKLKQHRHRRALSETPAPLSRTKHHPRKLHTAHAARTPQPGGSDPRARILVAEPQDSDNAAATPSAVGGESHTPGEATDGEQKPERETPDQSKKPSSSLQTGMFFYDSVDHAGIDAGAGAEDRSVLMSLLGRLPQTRTRRVASLVHAALRERTDRWQAEGAREPGIMPLAQRRLPGARRGATDDDSGDHVPPTGLIFLFRPGCKGWDYVWSKLQATTLSVVTGAPVVEGTTAGSFFKALQKHWPEWVHVIGAGAVLFDHLVLQQVHATTGKKADTVAARMAAAQSRYLRSLIVPLSLAQSEAVPPGAAPLNSRLHDLLVELGCVRWVTFSGEDTIDFASQFVQQRGVGLAVGWDNADSAPEVATAFHVRFYSTLANRLRAGTSAAHGREGEVEGHRQGSNSGGESSGGSSGDDGGGRTGDGGGVLGERLTVAWNAAFHAARSWEANTRSALPHPSNPKSATTTTTTTATSVPVPVSVVGSQLLPRAAPARVETVVATDAADGGAAGTGVGTDQRRSGEEKEEEEKQEEEDELATAVTGGFLSKRYLERSATATQMKSFLFSGESSSSSSSDRDGSPVVWLLASSTRREQQDLNALVRVGCVFGSGGGWGVRSLLSRLHYDVAIQGHFSGGIARIDCAERSSATAATLRDIARSMTEQVARGASVGAATDDDGGDVRAVVEHAANQESGGPCLLLIEHVQDASLARELASALTGTESRAVLVPDSDRVLHDPAQQRLLLDSCRVRGGDRVGAGVVGGGAHAEHDATTSTAPSSASYVVLPPLPKPLQTALAGSSTSSLDYNRDARRLLDHSIVAGCEHEPSPLGISIVHALHAAGLGVVHEQAFFTDRTVASNGAADAAALARIRTTDPLFYFAMQFAVSNLRQWFPSNDALAADLCVFHACAFACTCVRGHPARNANHKLLGGPPPRVLCMLLEYVYIRTIR